VPKLQSGASEVQGFPSTQVVPDAGKQTLGVDSSPSWLTQRSPLVQELPSSGQGVPSATFVWVTPWLPQASSVHGLPSSTDTGKPAQVPAAQASPLVHGSPSSQPPLVFGAQAPPAQVPHCPQLVQRAPPLPHAASVLDTH
jgi:hypothetical protein